MRKLECPGKCRPRSLFSSQDSRQLILPLVSVPTRGELILYSAHRGTHPQRRTTEAHPSTTWNALQDRPILRTLTIRLYLSQSAHSTLACLPICSPAPSAALRTGPVHHSTRPRFSFSSALFVLRLVVPTYRFGSVLFESVLIMLLHEQEIGGKNLRTALKSSSSS